MDLFESLQAQGFVRVRVRTEGKAGQGQIHELDDPPALNKLQKHSIDVVIDRIKVTPRRRCCWPTAAPSRNR